MSGLATLGDMVFRINPSDIKWNFQINTSVEETVGGRVVQVMGATLSNITVTGFYGQDRSKGPAGESAKLAEAFVQRIRQLMEKQSSDSKNPTKMGPPLVFTYSPYMWKFDVYIVDLSDPDGGSIFHKTGKFSYQYQLTLFIVSDGSAEVAYPGSSNGAIEKTKSTAVSAYIERIAPGLGWKLTGFNDPFGEFDILGEKVNKSMENAAAMGLYVKPPPLPTPGTTPPGETPPGDSVGSVGWMPDITKKEVKYPNQKKRSAHKAAILHTNGSSGSTPSLESWWKQQAAKSGKQTGAHFQVATDGTIEQYVSTEYVANHAWDASKFAVGIETQDNGHSKTDPWSAAQIASILKILKWIGVPKKKLADPSPQDGLGYHALFDEFNKRNHACPDDARIAQFQSVLDQM